MLGTACNRQLQLLGDVGRMQLLRRRVWLSAVCTACNFIQGRAQKIVLWQGVTACSLPSQLYAAHDTVACAEV